MAYRLHLDHSARNEIRSAAVDQLESAVQALAETDEESRPEAVHTARKSVKKARALLRLARSGMPRAAYREENRALREVGRSLSAVRDADVLGETVDELGERCAGQLPARVFQDLRRDVTALAGIDDTGRRVASAATALRTRTTSAAAWPLEDVRWSTVRDDARRAYARGREAFKAARASSDDEVMHEWRKRAKDLWYHQRLLRDVWKPVMRAHVDEVDELSDVLGDHHDLAVLHGFLVDHRAELGSHAPLAEIAELTVARREELRADALVLGSRIYAERPKAYGERIGRYIKAARATEPTSVSAASSS